MYIILYYVEFVFSFPLVKHGELSHPDRKQVQQ